jgi:hypothetical protein
VGDQRFGVVHDLAQARAGRLSAERRPAPATTGPLSTAGAAGWQARLIGVEGAERNGVTGDDWLDLDWE